MRKLCVILFVSLGAATALAQDKPSMVGNWKMDIAQSDFGSDPAPKSESNAISDDSPQLLSFRVHRVDDKGKPSVYSWRGPEDGSMHPGLMNGKPYNQAGLTREQDGTLVQHSEDPDGSTFEARISMSPDGNTLTAEGSSKSKDGKETRNKQVYHRVGGANGKPAS